jgi:hypothetical protein
LPFDPHRHTESGLGKMAIRLKQAVKSAGIVFFIGIFH